MTSRRLAPLEGDDIEAVRSALHRVRYSDELLGIDDLLDREGRTSELRDAKRMTRRALVDELVGFLEAREDLIDLQTRSGLDPQELWNLEVDDLGTEP
jgi:hypothetical protein